MSEPDGVEGVGGAVPAGEVDADVAEAFAAMPEEDASGETDLYRAGYGSSRVRWAGVGWVALGVAVAFAPAVYGLIRGGRVSLGPPVVRLLLTMFVLLALARGIVQIVSGRDWRTLRPGTRVLLLVLILLVAPVLALYVFL